jgi:Mg2+/Co2+ transporter CorB
MQLLLIYLFTALVFSFLCSLLESVLLSVTPGFMGAYEKKSPRTGSLLRRLKNDIDRPLTAILSLNTMAHTVGAAGVGAQSMVVFGSEYVAITSAGLTFLILVFTEIIPKTYGRTLLAGADSVYCPNRSDLLILCCSSRWLFCA